MNILICGVGGQGTVLASKILAESAVIAGSAVACSEETTTHSLRGWRGDGAVARTGETIGMSQRGGSVVSHVRTGKNASPYIPAHGADLVIAFEKCEAARCMPFLKAGGKALVSLTEIKPVAVSLGAMKYQSELMESFIKAHSDALFIDTDTLSAPFLSGKCTNTFLIGAALGGGFLNIGKEHVIAAMEKLIKPKFLEVNIQAFEAGFKTAAEYTTI
jgi:indolepyruvate ferredoxin oxidoreductase beta subunit